MTRSLQLFCAALGLATLASAIKVVPKNFITETPDTCKKCPDCPTCQQFFTTKCGMTMYHPLKVGKLDRIYHLLVPPALCNKSGADASIRHAPLVLGFSCLGCKFISEEPKQAIAAAGMVLAIPESTGDSWNAEVCCGPALEANTDDVGFVKLLLDRLLNSSEIVPGLRINREAVYAWGWSNGGFMASKVMKALPGYFRGQVPVSGHVYDMTGMNTPKTVSIHWGKKDLSVRFGGCCASDACCCGIGEKQGQTCRSVDNIFSRWLTVNSCSGVSNSSSETGMDCQEGIGCTRPTQLCTRPEGGHDESNKQDGAHIAQFLARDVCSINGRWQTGACTCNSGAQGPLCLD